MNGRRARDPNIHFRVYASRLLLSNWQMLLICYSPISIVQSENTLCLVLHANGYTAYKLFLLPLRSTSRTPLNGNWSHFLNFDPRTIPSNQKRILHQWRHMSWLPIRFDSHIWELRLLLKLETNNLSKLLSRTFSWNETTLYSSVNGVCESLLDTEKGLKLLDQLS